jgi:uncharacterized membrane protein YfcA
MTFLGVIDPLYSLSGFAIGMLVGMTGVGGGSLMTPLLVLLFHVQPHTAVGTDLLYAAITKSAGAAVHGRNRTVDWRVVSLLALGSVPATVLTLAAIAYFQPASSSSALISTVLGVALILTAISILFRKQIMDLAVRSRGDISAARTVALTVLTGAVLGVLVSMSSVGAGALGITVLFFLYPKLPVATIVGSDIAHAVPLTLVAGLGHWFLGDVNFAMLLSLLIGSIPGIIIGSHLSFRVPESVLRPILAATLILVGGRLAL